MIQQNGYSAVKIEDANVQPRLQSKETKEGGVIWKVIIVLVLCGLVLQPRFASHYRHVPRCKAFEGLVQLTNPQVDLRGESPCEYRSIVNDARTLAIPDLKNGISLMDKGKIVDGEYVPPKCKALFSTAILVPYRNRKSQLDVFLPYIHNFLRDQNIHYRVFVVEQSGDGPWNKGKLYNAGARLVSQMGFPCLVLHDVDMLPLSPANLFACSNHPRHLSASIDKFRYNLPYDFLIGGALAMLSDQYLQVNGFSNRFEGWGGEDDDLFQRLASENLTVQRFPPDMSKYTMLVHKQEPINKNRFKLLKDNQGQHKTDGLSSLEYEEMVITHQHLYTNVTVRL